MSQKNPWLFRAILLIPVVVLFSACGGNSDNDGPSDVAELFYEHQEPGAGPFPTEIFQDDDIRGQIESQIIEHQLLDGTIVSRKKVGSNKMVSLGDQGRIDKVTFVYEVEYENCRTRETIVLQRNRSTKAYKIVSYQIDAAAKMKDVAPMGTSSA